MRLVILGAGGFGHTVADVAQQLNKYDEILFLDDDATKAVGNCEDYINYIDNDTEMYPAFGNNEVRLNWMLRLLESEAQIPLFIHPTAYVSPMAEIEKGTIILPHAIVNTSCSIGKGCIINCGAIVDHGCVIDDGVHICLGAIVKGDNHINRGVKIEAGEVIQARMYPV